MSWVSPCPWSLQCSPSPRPSNMQGREGCDCCFQMPPAASSCLQLHCCLLLLDTTTPRGHTSPRTGRSRTCFHREFCPHPSLPTATVPPTQRVSWLLLQCRQCCEQLPWLGRHKASGLGAVPLLAPGEGLGAEGRVQVMPRAISLAPLTGNPSLLFGATGTGLARSTEAGGRCGWWPQ